MCVGGFDAEEGEMDGCKCFCWNRGGVYDLVSSEPEPFSLPAPIPEWPKGKGFAKGIICLGELEVMNITKFQCIWTCCVSKNKREGASFYKPVAIPDGFSSLGDYGQSIGQPFQGFLLAARAAADSKDAGLLPPLQKPIDYELIWYSATWQEDNHGGGPVFFWLPRPPENYRAAGYVVTNDSSKPPPDEVRCVRADLTDSCEAHEPILRIESTSFGLPFTVRKSRPLFRGMRRKGVPAGTFCCGANSNFNDEMNISCLKNLDPSLLAMPNLDQVHALAKHYGPTVFFHPKETYLPSSVPWFFTNGAALYARGDDDDGRAIDASGSILPCEGDNDGEYWMDLPGGDRAKHGNIESAELYIHVKPALGGTFTDVAMWVFCPFNGPATLKVGLLNISLKHIGQHVGDWEHFTLRISNFSGELSSVYFSEHGGGEWVDASGLEFAGGNRAAVYSSKSGHASFPRPGTYLQGSGRLGIGVRDDAARSELYVDSSVRYQIVAAEYMGGVISEPCWLQYMREWGPTVEYNSRSEVDKVISFLPVNLRCTVENVLDKLPAELFREEGPTGPKQKDNWEGDERT